MTTEEWREVPGFPDYEVSDQGRVWSRSRTVTMPHPRSGNPYDKPVGGHFLKGTITYRKGKPMYVCVLLRRDGEKAYRHVHSLVLEAFAGPCPKSLQACHNDGDGTNNRRDNLRWDTVSNNHYDTVKHGGLKNTRWARGENNGRAVLTEEAVMAIRKAAGKRGFVKALAQEHGVTMRQIWMIRTGNSWSSNHATAN